MAPIAQSDLFWGQKWCFSAGNSFFRDIIQKIVAIVTGHQKDNSFVLTHCMAGLWGGGRVHFWPKIDPKNCFIFTLHPVALIFGAQADQTLGDHNCYLAQNPLCGDHIQKCCYHHDGTSKRQPFCVDNVPRPGFKGNFWS